ncbi:MAG: DUF84 family protein [Gammaproteobacteria bacterium]|nr:DUF84 family protein [Gammaproteobacteria bacterium]
MKTVIVGSKNPVKVNATRIAFESVFANESFTVEGLSAASGVNDQPFGEDETYQGALNRATNSQAKQPEADFWVGIESGIDDQLDTLEVFNWIVILSHEGLQGRAKSGSYLVPQTVSQLVKQGQELADACFKIFGDKTNKTEGGLVAYLTGGALDRTHFYVPAIQLALAAIIHPELYQSSTTEPQRRSA